MFIRRLIGAALLLISCSAGARPLDRIDANALLPATEAFVLLPLERSAQTLKLSWNIAPGYYLYRPRIRVELLAPSAIGLQAIELPAGSAHEDEFFGKVEIYRGLLEARVPLSATPQQPLRVRIRFQGCADTGVCYPPQTVVQTLAP